MAAPPAGAPQRATQQPKVRPDPKPLRLAIGMTGLAAASAIATALLTPPGTDAGVGATPSTVTLSADSAPIVRHVVRYVQLAPGQVAPAQAVVRQQAAPKPRVVVVTTRQSGKP